MNRMFALCNIKKMSSSEIQTTYNVVRKLKMPGATNGSKFKERVKSTIKDIYLVHFTPCLGTSIFKLKLLNAQLSV